MALLQTQPVVLDSALDALRVPQVPRESRSGGVTETPNLPGTCVGQLIGFTNSGRPLVRLAANDEGEPVEARSTCALARTDVGIEVVVLFENGHPQKPIIIGRIQPSVAPTSDVTRTAPVHVSLDGEQLILTAQKEIVLRCGKASLTLTRAGKVLIRGAYLLSRSSGVNRIKGGSVQIN